MFKILSNIYDGVFCENSSVKNTKAEWRVANHNFLALKYSYLGSKHQKIILKLDMAEIWKVVF